MNKNNFAYTFLFSLSLLYICLTASSPLTANALSEVHEALRKRQLLVQMWQTSFQSKDNTLTNLCVLDICSIIINKHNGANL